METFETYEYIILICTVVIALAIWGMYRVYYFNLTKQGRTIYVVELRKRIANYTCQIHELESYATMAAVACNDTPHLARARSRQLRRLGSWRTRARIALFIIRRL